MLNNEILSAKTRNKIDENKVVSPIMETKHGSIINLTTPDENKFFLKHQFRSFSMPNKSVARNNSYRYKMSRPLNYEIATLRRDNCFKSQNLRLETSSFGVNKSFRELSRSAKIMRALSFNCNSSNHRNVNIKKSLNFDSTPSPDKCDNFDESTDTSTKINTNSCRLKHFLKLDTNSTDSSASSILITSSESIDENQNQTPQRNRKFADISSNQASDIMRNVNKLKSRGSTSLLRSELRKSIDDIISNTQFLKQNNDKLIVWDDMRTSTPNNLLHSENEYHRSCTPENMVRSIPESMSAVKKSHKKEKSYRRKKEASTKRINTFIRNDNCSLIELLGLDDTPVTTNVSYTRASVKKSQKKSKSIKQTLLYNPEDESSDNGSIFDNYVNKQKAIRMMEESNLAIDKSDKLKDDKIEDIDSSDFEIPEINIQDGNNRHNEEENHVNEDKEVYLLEETSNTSSINNTSANENRAIPPELNQITSHNYDAVVTPENRIHFLQRILTESIKKSHKKAKDEIRKSLHKSEIPRLHKVEISQLVETSQQGIHQCEDSITNKGATCTLESQNLSRSTTPEDVNSSRLLLSQFSSIKKSHKKDKLKRAVSHSLKYHEKNIILLQDNEYETNFHKILCKNDSRQLEKSINISSDKKSLETSSDSSERLYMDTECETINNDFKIYTPIKKRSSTALAVTNRVLTDTTSPENDQYSPVISSKKIDLSRCVTPISSYCFRNRELREDKNLDTLLTYEANTQAKIENKVCVPKKEIDTINLMNKDGRLTPINMSTSELLCNIDPIKKSHKKDKYNHGTSKRRVLIKKQPYIEEIRNIDSTTATDILEECPISSLKHHDIDSIASESCSVDTKSIHERHEETLYDQAQSPSTSRENLKSEETLKILNTTPPNNQTTVNFIKLIHTTSIKRFHKEERNHNAQAKYILMSKEHELSDDGSIFDEEDRLDYC